MRSSPYHALISKWKKDADELRHRYFDERGAQLFEEHATELAQAVAASDDQLLTLAEAAHESGYSADHLGRLVRTGSLRNHGRRYAPRVRRGELPSKPRRIERRAGNIDIGELFRDIIHSKRGEN
jgi:hypothetical protein